MMFSAERKEGSIQRAGLWASMVGLYCEVHNGPANACQLQGGRSGRKSEGV